MGLLDKIEDKLGGSKHSNTNDKHHNIERKSLDRQGHDINDYRQPGATTAHGTSGTGNYDQTRNHAGQAPLTGAAAGLHSSQHDSTTTGSKTHDLRHPVQAATGRGEYGQYSSGNSGVTGTGRDTYGSDGTYKTHPTEPVDPYSTKGQNAMHAAAPGTSVHDQAGGSTFDSGVDRSRHGGVTNAMTGGGHNTGHQGMGNRPGAGGGVNLENPDAIPTAGGEKVGGLDNRYGNESGHHYGRDTAGAGGAGALAHEEHNKHGHGGGLSKILPGKHHNDTSSTDQYGGRDRLPQSSSHTDRDGYGNSGIGSGHNDHHYGRDAAIVGGAGALGHEAGRGRHAHDPTTSTGGYVGSNSHHPTSSIGGSHTGSGNMGSSGQLNDHHYGRDAALAGGALGASHEATKRYNDTPGQQSGMPHTGYSTTSGTTQGSNVGGAMSGHHPHHKEQKEIEARLEEIRLERRLEEIKAAGGNTNQI